MIFSSVCSSVGAGVEQPGSRLMSAPAALSKTIGEDVEPLQPPPSGNRAGARLRMAAECTEHICGGEKMSARKEWHPEKVRSGLTHPVIDGDGHWIEYGPIFAEKVRMAAGDKAAD